MRKRHKQIGLGGTFDHFHDGHQKLILFAADLGEKLLIGVTDQKLTLHKAFPHTIESYEERARSVANFCQTHHLSYSITRLTDPFGPTLENSEIDALAVTPETSLGASKINELRTGLSLKPLPIYICDFFLAENRQPLHADAIRTGTHNRHGVIYNMAFTQDVLLNEMQRTFFQTPQGEVFQKPDVVERGTFIAVVGDHCLEKFIENQWPYHLGIFDKKQQRISVNSANIDAIKPDEKVVNEAGKISLSLIKALQTALIQKHKHLEIVGEEDLAAVALVLAAPLDSVIYYGQPNVGMIKMIATEALKNQFYQVLKNPNLSQT